uniref:F-box protein AT5G49610-like beta-propeller domain-containing protein n=1 Tax=Arundo donax TaxID=35708 RepID=A0A0A9HE84_ARUDO
MYWDDSSLVVFNPLTRRSADAFDLGPEDMFEDRRGHYAQLNSRLLFSDEDPTSFRVVLLAHDESRIRATVFSSETGEWSVLPWVDVPAPVSSDDNCWIQNEASMQANGFLYWVYEDRRHLISLDTGMMEFSVPELPPCLRHCSFDVGETKDAAPCIVYSDQLSVGVLMHIRDNDGVERWMLDRVVPLGTELQRVLRGEMTDTNALNHLVDDPSELNVLAVRDGYAYLATSLMYHDPQTPCWFLSLCLETMQLERLFRRTFDNAIHPYIMAWPPCLVGNYGSFAHEDAP